MENVVHDFHQSKEAYDALPDNPQRKYSFPFVEEVNKDFYPAEAIDKDPDDMKHSCGETSVETQSTYPPNDLLGHHPNLVGGTLPLPLMDPRRVRYVAIPKPRPKVGTTQPRVKSRTPPRSFGLEEPPPSEEASESDIEPCITQWQANRGPYPQLPLDTTKQIKPHRRGCLTGQLFSSVRSFPLQ